MPALDFTTWVADDLLKAIALVGAAVAFVIGVLQYRIGQRWKRAEWVAQEMKGLFDDPLVKSALFMIDWDDGQLSKLFPNQGFEKDRNEILENSEINRALAPHSERSNGFSPLEAEVRSAFDHLLDGINRFHSYFATGLVTKSDLKPYLGYWARAISDPNATKKDRAYHLRIYMTTYDFGGALRLLERLARPDLKERIAQAFGKPPKTSNPPSPNTPKSPLT